MTTEQRMERLERQNERLRGGLCALILMWAALLLMGQAAPRGVPQEIRAKRFIVVNDKNQQMVILTSAELGGGVIDVYNRKDAKAVTISTTEGDDRGAIATYDGKGKELVLISSSGGGRGMVSTFDGEGGKLVALGASIEGEGMVLTYNRAGGIRAAWPTR